MNGTRGGHVCVAVFALILSSGALLRPSVGSGDVAGLVSVRERARVAEVARMALAPDRFVDEVLPGLDELGSGPVRRDTLAFAARIGFGGSPYQAVLQLPRQVVPPADRPALIAQLTEIYRQRLGPGHDFLPDDMVRVVYEREVWWEGPAGSPRVLAAEIVTRDRSHFAFAFGDEYYDEAGRPLRLSFRRSPLEDAQVTSAFGFGRVHPVTGRSVPHVGIDLRAPIGTPVHATADGRVAFAGPQGGYGQIVVLEHAEGYESRYAHLSRFAPGMRAGAFVRQGEVIAYSGATGRVTGPHLHYELRQHGRPVDPARTRLPVASPVAPSERVAFRDVVDDAAQLLSGAYAHRVIGALAMRGSVLPR